MTHAILNFGADVNGLNDNGSAAIHVAVEKSRLLANFYKFLFIETILSSLYRSFFQQFTFFVSFLLFLNFGNFLSVSLVCFGNNYTLV